MGRGLDQSSCQHTLAPSSDHSHLSAISVVELSLGESCRQKERVVMKLFVLLQRPGWARVSFSNSARSNKELFIFLAPYLIFFLILFSFSSLFCELFKLLSHMIILTHLQSLFKNYMSMCMCVCVYVCVYTNTRGVNLISVFSFFFSANSSQESFSGGNYTLSFWKKCCQILNQTTFNCT